MKAKTMNKVFCRIYRFIGAPSCALLLVSNVSSAQQLATAHSSTTTSTAVRTFDTPQQAAAVLVEAANKFDVPMLMQIFGPDGDDVVFSGEFAQDRKHAADFVAEAEEKNTVSVDPKSNRRAFLPVGNEDWPLSVPRRG